jgi:hypothetical protein
MAGDVIRFVTDTPNKLIPFMVRPAQDERNQLITVRPVLVEGLIQRFLKEIHLKMGWHF